jgi:hypothetical protein
MTTPHLGPSTCQPRDRSWPFWPLVPLYPYGQRRTICREVVPGTIWCFEQLQGILYVVTPIRMSVIKLAAGGLLVYAPVAPTSECLTLIQKLVTAHGPVKFIILPTASGLEHKVFVGPFARRFPEAQVFVVPHQWSFPLDLPLSWLGLPGHRTYVLPIDSSDTPFAQEFDYALLGPISLGLGTFAEAAFFHRPSQTLLLTDTLISVPQEPPEIVQCDPYPLLFHAKDSTKDLVMDTLANRRKGWERIVLFSLFFRPAALEIMPLRQAWQAARQGVNRTRKAYFGLYPFQWQGDWQQSFKVLQGQGCPFVAPILQALILNRAPQETWEWVLRVANWEFQRMVACHFDTPVSINPRQFRQAFLFLEPSQLNSEEQFHGLPEADFKLLREIEQRLTQWRILPPTLQRNEVHNEVND